jgi:hypothetical protein
MSEGVFAETEMATTNLDATILPVVPQHEIKQRSERDLPSSDPRDYIRVTAFQKKARVIDADPKHPWETIPDNMICRSSEDGDIYLAQSHDRADGKTGLLVAARKPDGETQSAYIKDLDPGVRDFVYDTIGIASSRFPATEKHELIRRIIEITPQLREMPADVACETVATLAINLIPDQANLVRVEQLPQELPRVSYGKPEADELQQDQLRRFFSQISTKLSPEEFKSRLDRFFSDIPFTDNIYDGNFKYIFSDGLRWVVESRLPKTTISLSEADFVEHFPVEKLVGRKVKSKEQLKAVLKEETALPEPDTNLLTVGKTAAEFVDPKKVVGGPGIADWSVVSESEGRGLDNIFKFTGGFADGSIDVVGRNKPIVVSEIGGNYFIGRDGRHRVAALKALDIPFVPMLVTHYNRTEEG